MEQPTRSPSFDVPILGPQIQQMIECNQRLTELGIESTVDLPRICVVGDQSAGKSSLIEALSRIRVPRAANCCTRCPLEINLSRAESPTLPWMCKISLIKGYAYDHQNKGRDPNKAFPMGPWIPMKEPESLYFAESADQNEVRKLIHKAQLATLNPGTNPTFYGPNITSAEVPETLQVKFSPNIVRIDISCGVWVNLSFIDLPGVISVADSSKERHLVKLVENLVKHYAQAPSSINLLALPMSDDVANSRALSIIQDLKAEKRTLGVLTKPDRVQNDASREPYLSMLRGEDQYQLQHGFHVVMMPPDVDISWDEARTKEMEHFNCEPWSTLEPAGRVGVDLLSQKLRVLLQQKISDNLPHIRHKINERLSSVDAQLKAYPQPPLPAWLAAILVQLLMSFKDAMKKLFLEGGGNMNKYPLKSKWKKLADSFKAKLDTLQPTMVLSTKDEQRRMGRAESFLLRARTTSEPKQLPTTPVKLTPAKVQGQAVVCLSSDEEEANNHSGSVQSNHRKTFNLSEVKKMNLQRYEGDIPTLIVPSAIKAMNEDCLAYWSRPTNEFMDQTADLVKSRIAEVTDLVFEKCRHMQIYQEVIALTQKFLDAAFEGQKAKTKDIFDMERSHPFTLDSASLDREKQQALPLLKQERLNYRASLKRAEHEAGQVGKKAGKQVKVEDLPEELQWDTELEMMARVQAYYVIACSRFADHICQSIQASLFTQCGEALSEILDDKLGTSERSNFEQIVFLMTEDPERERQRLSLEQQKERMRVALREVEQVLGGGERRSSTPSPEDTRACHVASEVKSEDQRGGTEAGLSGTLFPSVPVAGRRRGFDEMRHG